MLLLVTRSKLRRTHEALVHDTEQPNELGKVVLFEPEPPRKGESARLDDQLTLELLRLTDTVNVAKREYPVAILRPERNVHR
jgi:hypothetical protein